MFRWGSGLLPETRRASGANAYFVQIFAKTLGNPPLGDIESLILQPEVQAIDTEGLETRGSKRGEMTRVQLTKWFTVTLLAATAAYGQVATGSLGGAI